MFVDYFLIFKNKLYIWITAYFDNQNEKKKNSQIIVTKRTEHFTNSNGT